MKHIITALAAIGGVVLLVLLLGSAKQELGGSFSDSRGNKTEREVLVNATSTEVGQEIAVTDFNTLTFTLAGYTGASGTVKVACSTKDFENIDFSSDSEQRNPYDFMDVTDLEDGASIDGDTGIVFTGAASTTRMVQINNANVRTCALMTGPWEEDTRVYGYFLGAAD